jgi:hypothetical protein
LSVGLESPADHNITDHTKGGGLEVLLLILLIVLAVATGVLGAVIKGAFWLFVLTVIFLACAFVAGRAGRSRSS